MIKRKYMPKERVSAFEKLELTNAKEWKKGCYSWALLSSLNLFVLCESMESGCTESEHFHKEIDQFFILRAGTAVFWIDGKERFLDIGDTFFVERKQRHYIRNNGTEKLEFMLISTGDTALDRVDVH